MHFLGYFRRFFTKNNVFKELFRSFPLKSAILWPVEIYLDGTLTLQDEVKAMQDTLATNSKSIFSIEDLTPEQQQILTQNILIMVIMVNLMVFISIMLCA
jgi:hypothetical protein